jgi:DNA-binding PadR family transcriptional regulator
VSPTPKPKPLKPHWFHILLALADHDLHGLGIMEEVSTRTEGTVHLWPGMLYGALRRMLELGFVVERQQPPDAQPGGGKPRYYGITEPGRQALAEEVGRLSTYVTAARGKNVLHNEPLTDHEN